LKILAKNAARPWGFTLIELLTVVAIIAVLATLLTATLGSVKKKARKTASISNLRQIALAYNLYADDHRKRPTTYAEMVQEKLLNERVLICPEDRLIGNWAGLIEGGFFTDRAVAGIASNENAPVPPPEIAHSYFKSFDAPDEIWERIEKSPLGGIAACQLHGIGRQSLEPEISAYQGLVLRALKDMSVISRQVFWSDSQKAGFGNSAPSASLTPTSPQTDLPLFIDETE
jgi:prepilin-type N-terminal cleavage/methylation domain-containing protein